MENFKPNRHEPYHCDLIEEDKMYQNHYFDISGKETSFKLETHNDKKTYLFSLDELLEIRLTLKQLKDLRASIERTEEEEKVEYKDSLK